MDEQEVAAALELLGGLLGTNRSGWDLAYWQRVLSTLPPRYRRVVILAVIHGMTHEAIGERLGVGRHRIHQMFKAACRKLRAPLAATQR